MGITMDMLKVIDLNAPAGAVPQGLKVTALSGPQSGPQQQCPVLTIGGFTLWPMSYIDNRVSFGMVMYDPGWKPVAQVERAGARYVYKITLDGTGETGSVTFWGQADEKVSMTVAELDQLLVEAPGK